MNHTDQLPVTRYTPESQMRSPLKLLRSMLRDLKQSRELAWRLFVRDLSASYRQSFLGVVWAFLPALLAGVLFTFLQKKSIVNFAAVDLPYPVFAIVGTTLWQVFSESVNAPLRTLQGGKAMLAKINFPREALILSAVYEILFSFCIKLAVVIAVMGFCKVPLGAGVLLSLPAVLALVLLGLALGMFLAPVGLLYNDVGSALMALLSFWFFLTPVVYPSPQQYPYSLLALLNPVSPLLNGGRELLAKGTLADPFPLFVVTGCSMAAFVVAWAVFRVALPVVVERISA